MVGRDHEAVAVGADAFVLGERRPQLERAVDVRAFAVELVDVVVVAVDGCDCAHALVDVTEERLVPGEPLLAGIHLATA
jgi:hypothetical protein